MVIILPFAPTLNIIQQIFMNPGLKTLYLQLHCKFPFMSYIHKHTDTKPNAGLIPGATKDFCAHYCKWKLICRYVIVLFVSLMFKFVFFFNNFERNGHCSSKYCYTLQISQVLGSAFSMVTANCLCQTV